MWKVTEASYQSPHWLGQDRTVVRALSPACTLVAVMDGHGETSDTVHFCHNHLTRYPLVAPRLNDAEAFLRYVYEQMHKATWWRMDGCTVTAGLLYKSGHAVLATLGDSPWLVRHGHKRARRGPTHNVNINVADRRRAVSAGARYDYPYLCVGHVGLQLTRALGDSAFKDVLERTPETTVLPRRRRGAWIALITDGVWEELFGDSDLTFTALVHSLCNGADAQHLVAHHGLEKKDDRAAVVCRFE